YYACATGEAAPKPKASAKRKRGGSASSTTPPTPIATPTSLAAQRLTTAAKGKQPARATSPTEPSDVERTEAKQLKIVLRRCRHGTHISQQGGSSTNEETGSIPGVPDVPSDDSKEKISWNSSDDESEEEETTEKEEESFDPISRNPEESEDDGNGMESIFMIGSSFITPIPSPKSTMTPSIMTTTTTASQPPIPPTAIPRNDGGRSRGCANTKDQLQDSIQRENDEFLRTIDDNMKKIIKEQVKSQVKTQVTRIFPRIEEFVNAQLKAEVLTKSSHSSRTSYAVAADLSEMEMKKILIDKMEGNKSIQ
nr:hypothetical protein [Tanacetum cinerariifolium]